MKQKERFALIIANHNYLPLNIKCSINARTSKFLCQQQACNYPTFGLFFLLGVKQLSTFKALQAEDV